LRELNDFSVQNSTAHHKCPCQLVGEIEEENNMADKTTHNVEARINLADPAFSGVMKAMYGLEGPLRDSGLEPALRELVKTRASQINGCAYCIDMHTKDARAQGET
jgi:AhpD family alkylhydroperoxidase